MKRWQAYLLLVFTLFFFCGCEVHRRNAGMEATVFFNQVFLIPMEFLFNRLSDDFNFSYGVSLIVLILLVRSILLPLTMFSSVKSLNKSTKLQILKNDISSLRDKIDKAENIAEKQLGYTRLKEFNRKYGLKTFDILGMLPLFIQMPIISALFFMIKNNSQISSSFILGINLGKRSIVFSILIFVIYFLQTKLSVDSMDSSDITNRKILFISPLIISLASFTTPAGLNLYLLISGLFSCIQSYLINYTLKPHITKKVEESIRISA